MKKENRRIPPPLLSKFQFFERHLEIVNPGGTKSRWALVRRAFRRGGSIPRSSRREEEGGEERRDYEKEGGARSRKVGGAEAEEDGRGKDDDEDDDDERAEQRHPGTLSTSRKNSIEAASFCRV